MIIIIIITIVNILIIDILPISGQNRHSSTEHDQYKVAGGSSTCYRGIVPQRSHPQGKFNLLTGFNLWFAFTLKGSSSYGLPAPVAVDYSQGNLPTAFVNPNCQGSQTFPQSKHRKFVVNLILVEHAVKMTDN